MDFLAGLNPPQQEAVRHVHGPLLILAGAGSGKTRVVTHRISHLVRDHGVPGESILAVTFTNKAAREMRDRVENLLGGLAMIRGPEVSTFHSFCVRLLRRDGGPLAEIRQGFTPRFVIYDDDDQLALVKSIYRNLSVDDKSLPPRQVLSRISGAKNRQDGPEQLMRDARDPQSKRVAQIYELYESGLRQNGALDFDDLLLETVRLLRHDAYTRELYNRRFEFLMIDEYQDTNHCQYELIRLLSQSHSNVCVVGDEDQSIYSWRGADIRNILDFEKDFPNAKVIRLEQNYRSTKNILEAASQVISNNHERKGKWLWTDSDAGEKVTVYEAMDGENEALYIADEIQKAIARGVNRVAVLYRTNSQSRQVEEALRRYNVRYTVVGGLSFYQRAEIKDILAYLKLLALPQDSMSLMRVINTPARGIGKTTVEQIESWAAQSRMPIYLAMKAMLDANEFGGRAHAALSHFRMTIEDLRGVMEREPLPRLIEAVLERTGYKAMLEADTAPEAEARLENISELLNAAAEAAERGETISDFLDHAALVAQTDDLNDTASVSLLTVHNAKGLEFPVVFLAGMEEGLFPHSRSRDNEAMLEEERRLCYVGMTRAEKRLSMSWARARRKYGGGPMEPAIRSRFLLELPPQVIEEKGASKPAWGSQRPSAWGGSRDGWDQREYRGRDPFDQRSYDQRDSRSEERSPFGVGSMRFGQPPQSPTHGPPLPLASAKEPSNERPPWEAGNQVDLFSEQHEVRQAAEKNLFTGKTYNSVENISEFFEKRGLPTKAAPAVNPQAQAAYPPLAPKPKIAVPPPRPKKPFGAGSYVDHPKYGRGQVLRREGDGDEAKLTIMFPGHGIKKVVEKFAGLRVE
jgi:DNA helicase-2/ATP-dependent DNA helicase PcrA